jgi:ABC-type transport system involved in cytochrome c biogenesis permease component
MTLLPIVERDLRITARKPGTYWLRFTYAALTILIWLLFVLGNQHATPSVSLGQELYEILSSLVMLFCLASGVFLTADCLSEEKREGTLGLLFLTDLHGYDVVLGKLVATSLQAVYGLLATLPVLGLCVLLGGITGGEFARMVLVLLTTLFFSLASGMFISALSNEPRHALAGTASMLIVITAILPAIHWIVHFAFNTDLFNAVLWLSPSYAYRMAFDSNYKTIAGSGEFRASLICVFGMGLGLLGLANLLLPRLWQEGKAASRSKGSGWWQNLRFGTREFRKTSRKKLLEDNPSRWLATRDRLPAILSWGLIGLVLPLWICFVLVMFVSPRNGGDTAFEAAMYIAFGLHILFKCLVAVEATRRLSDDRQSGALELLLVTPLNEKQILTGQRRALWHHFKVPLFVLLAINLVLIWILNGPNPMKISDYGMISLVFVGGTIALPLDFYALGWVGMWMGLRAKRHNRAVMGTLLRVMVTPWLAFIFIMFLGTSGMSDRTGVWAFSLWIAFGIINDLLVARRAKRKLLEKFRHSATGTPAASKLPQSEMPPSLLNPVNT